MAQDGIAQGEAAPATGGPPREATLALTPAQARDMLGVLGDPGRRARFAQALQALAAAEPAAGATDGPPEPAAPATPTRAPPPRAPAVLPAASGRAPVAAAAPTVARAAPAAAPPAAAPAVPKLAPDSLGAQLISKGGNWFTSLSGQIAQAGHTMADVPLLWAWIERTLGDPDSRARVLDAAWKLAVVFGAGLGMDYAAWRALQGPVRRLALLAPEGSGEPDEDPASSDPDRAVEAGLATSALDLPPGPPPQAPAEPAGAAGTMAAAGPPPPDPPPPDLPPPDLPPSVSEQLSRPPEATPRDAAPGARASARPGTPAAGAGPAWPPLAPATPDPATPSPAMPAASASPESMRRRRHRTLRLLRRLPFVLMRLVLELLPLGAFLLTANLLLGTSLVHSANTRASILAYMQAYLFIRVLLCVLRTLLSPDQRRLRLVHVTDRAAAYMVGWARLLVLVAALGWATVETGMLFGLTTAAHEALLKLVALVDHLALVVIVLQLRRPVAARLHARRGATGARARALNRLAAVWHWIAIFYIMALWAVWASQIENGFGRVVHFFLVTCAVSIGSRLLAIVLLGGLDRAIRVSPEAEARYPGLQARTTRYYPAARFALTTLLVVLTGVAMLQAWGIGSLAFFWRDPLGSRITSATLTVTLAAMLAIAAWEGVNTGIDRQLERLALDAQAVRAARLRTLTPLMRTALLVVIVLVLGMTVLSEIGVNIAPLLAGAGIVGVALGFGSQKLVQDFITGIFLLLENAMQVGDAVTVAGLSGTVETLSIRTLRLRAGDGSMHIIPFSSVTTVNNANRDYANAAVGVAVGYAEDTDRVGAILAEIVAAMRRDARFAPMILDDFSLWGVDQLGEYSVTIKGQVQTTVDGRWPVQREINRRVKQRFAAEGIEVPHPVQTVLRTPGDDQGQARPEALPLDSAKG